MSTSPLFQSLTATTHHVSAHHLAEPEGALEDHRHPSNFSVLVSGIGSRIDSADGLAKLFKQGKVSEGSGIKAFIADPEADAPSGFHKVSHHAPLLLIKTCFALVEVSVKSEMSNFRC